MNEKKYSGTEKTSHSTNQLTQFAHFHAINPFYLPHLMPFVCRTTTTKKRNSMHVVCKPIIFTIFSLPLPPRLLKRNESFWKSTGTLDSCRLIVILSCFSATRIFDLVVPMREMTGHIIEYTNLSFSCCSARMTVVYMLTLTEQRTNR